MSLLHTGETKEMKKKHGMYCPNCGHRQYCCCKHCAKRRGLIKRFFEWLGIRKPEVWAEDGESIACGQCGLTVNAAWWAELDIDVMCKLAGVKTLTEYVEKMDAERAEKAY